MATVGDSRVPARLWRRIEMGPNGCWLWTGLQNRNGYGRTTRTNSRDSVMVHRYLFELLVAPIEEGLQLDHLCRVRRCCNPAHVEPVTQRVNLLRGATVTAASAAATQCPSGHPYEGDNLRISPAGHRYCRTCHRNRQAERRAREGDPLRVRQRAYDAAYRSRKREEWRP